VNDTLEAWLSVKFVEADGELLCAWMKIAVKPVVTSRRRGSGPATRGFGGSARLRAYLASRRGAPGLPLRLGLRGRRWSTGADPCTPLHSDMSGYPLTPQDDERPPSLGWGLLRRSLLAAS